MICHTFVYSIMIISHYTFAYVSIPFTNSEVFSYENSNQQKPSEPNQQFELVKFPRVSSSNCSCQHGDSSTISGGSTVTRSRCTTDYWYITATLLTLRRLE